MLEFEDFFTTCSGVWTTERIYHSTLTGEVERSFTEFRVQPITQPQKQQILTLSGLNGIKVDLENPQAVFPGFAIAFDTVSEKGEKVSMRDIPKQGRSLDGLPINLQGKHWK